MTELEWSWGRLQAVKLQPRSVSQLKEYMDELGGCAYRYFLNRVVRAWDMPAAWFPQGLAVHQAAEAWERSGRQMSRDEVIAVYQKSYRDHINAMKEITPNFNYWFPSGPHRGWDDIVRRAGIGQVQIERYLDYYAKHPEERIWITPKGEPAIEVEFNIQLDKVRIIGFIDQIISWYENLPDDLRIRDIKTGKKPGDTLQLKVYSIAVEDNYGVEILDGDYWMADKGKPTQVYALDNMSTGQVTDLFGRMNEGVNQEDFEPSPSPEKCRMCSVRSACRFAE